jgi:hypothetical protein
MKKELLDNRSASMHWLFYSLTRLSVFDGAGALYRLVPGAQGRDHVDSAICVPLSSGN